MQESRANRIARYKEERRQQLAIRCNEITSNLKTDESVSTPEGPRTTRASRLRAATTASNVNYSPSKILNGNDKTSSRSIFEKDKTSKRKSNLNMPLSSEEVLSDTNDDNKNWRRRRRNLSSPGSQASSHSNSTTLISGTTVLNSSPHTLSSTATVTTRSKVTNRNSSIHENKSKDITSVNSIYRTSPLKSKDKFPKSDGDVVSNCTYTDENRKRNDKENIKQKTDDSKPAKDKHSSNFKEKYNKRIIDLSALTRETLITVQKLSKENCGVSNDNEANNIGVTIKSSLVSNTNDILLEKSQYDTAIPVSILKRKVSQDESKSTTTHVTPVTFSPNVFEPSTSAKRQGILKKRRSLDELQVLRHRSCSPDIIPKSSSKSNKRRSSLEEITRLSSDSNIQGILKRTSRKYDDDQDNSLNSPQGILKRRSRASSLGPITNTYQHVSINTAVVLAAAKGAEIILDSDIVKPILKKKSITEDFEPNDNFNDNNLRPILKKKSSTDTDDADDKPKRPILKFNRANNESNSFSKCNYYSVNESLSDSDVKPILKQKPKNVTRHLSFSNNENINGEKKVVKPPSQINNFQFSTNNVKEREHDRSLTKPRVTSVFELVMNFEKSTGAVPKKSNFKRNSDRFKTQPITLNEFEEASVNRLQDFQQEFTQVFSTNICTVQASTEDDNKLNDFASNSISNLIMDTNNGAKSSGSDSSDLESNYQVPLNKKNPNQLGLQMKAIAEEAKLLKLKKVNRERNQSSDRFSTQPITLTEVQLAAKLPQHEKGNESKNNTSKDENTTLQNDSFSPKHNTGTKIERRKLSPENSVVTPSKQPANLEPLKLQMLATCKEAMSVKLRKTGSMLKNRDRDLENVSRFSTQPITRTEVEDAKNMTVYPKVLESAKEDPSNLTVAERIMLFARNNQQNVAYAYAGPKTQCDLAKKCEVRKLACALFPNTSTISWTLDEISDMNTSTSQSEKIKNSAYDEGISSNNSDSDSDLQTFGRTENSRRLKSSSSKSDQTSDESSGGMEIQSIIKKEKNSRKNQLSPRSHQDGCLLKTKSQSTFSNEKEKKLPHGIQKSVTTSEMQRTIGEIQAKLQQSGDNDWRKRLPKLNTTSEELTLLNVKNIYNDELSDKKSILKAKKDELDASAKQWKTRVEKTDAVNFSVAGRMNITEGKDTHTIPLNIINSDNSKRTPQPKRYKGKESENEFSSTPSSPNTDITLSIKRSISVPTPTDLGSSPFKYTSRIVEVLKTDDETYQSFFKSIDSKRTTEHINISVDDFDIVSDQAEALLVQKRIVNVQKKKKTATKNPLKALAARSDIQNEYLEITTGIAEREIKRLNIEKLSKNSNLAVEALAGLASNEDFASVALKKSAGPNISYLPFKNIMLLQIKGRRHVQTRLVEPVPASINQGDNFILITSSALYNYIGPFSNIIEQSRAADIINHIEQSGDMGCKIDKAITINAKKNDSKDFENFCKLISPDVNIDITDAGHPDEDEIYESSIVNTNMIYKLENNELAPYEEYWGAIPKIEILEPSKVLVFDFGTELYVWSGINANPEEKKTALNLAKELWDNGYNYVDCNVCPLTIANMLGARNKSNDSFKGDSRPEWALFAKITQHRETILFREKFLDWPNYTRVIRVVKNTNEKSVDTSLNIQPYDANKLIDVAFDEPDLEVEGCHLGRGRTNYDNETKRCFEINTLEVTCWKIFESTYEKLDENSVGHFYDAETYIIKWMFRVSVTGRELSGKPSKHAMLGRDRCIYFCWLGKNSTINEKGTAALLTVELDLEHARQIRIMQGSEPPAFLQLFDGKMFVHIGRKLQTNDQNARLYICRGEIECESMFIEVPCSTRSLRSRSSFLLIEKKKITIWNGTKSLQRTQDIVNSIAEYIQTHRPPVFNLLEDVEMVTYNEEDETQFLQGDSENRLYRSLINDAENYENSPRLFYFNSVLGNFEATELLCAHRSVHTTPYPFLQSDLYSVNQPALFLFDNKHELWLWQGWWPEREDLDLYEQTGSGVIRWQAERRAAMETAIDYWKLQHCETKTIPAYLVWAGLEPLSFTNLFPVWYDRDDIAEINIKDGRKAGDIVSIEKELSLLTRTTYPLSELLQRPLPNGVDPTHLEIYLSPEEFTSLLSMSKEDFQNLPSWKQTALKKDKGLF